MNFKHLFFTLIILFFLTESKAQDTTYFPEKNAAWQTKPAIEFNIDSSLLQEAVTFASENEYSGSKDLRIAILKGFAHEPYHQILGPTKKRGGPAGMILKNGYVIASWGDVQRVDMTFSVTKSFLSTVAGLAVDKGLIANVNDKAKNYVWDGTFKGNHNSKITWAHLLNQSSDWTGTLWGGHDWADRPPREGGIDDWKFRELREPGTVMEYNDVRVNLLAYSLLQVWRQPLPKVLKKHIMDPIGASTTWRWHGYSNSWTLVDGIKMQSVSGGGHSGGGMFISAEDMARFGLLFENNGDWNGKQLLSQKWIEDAVRPSTPNPNYGYMWWINSKGSRQWEGVSESIFYAAGFGGNYIVVDRENDLVVVTRWLEPSKLKEFIQKLMKALP